MWTSSSPVARGIHRESQATGRLPLPARLSTPAAGRRSTPYPRGRMSKSIRLLQPPEISLPIFRGSDWWGWGIADGGVSLRRAAEPGNRSLLPSRRVRGKMAAQPTEGGGPAHRVHPPLHRLSAVPLPRTLRYGGGPDCGLRTSANGQDSPLVMAGLDPATQQSPPVASHLAGSPVLRRG